MRGKTGNTKKFAGTSQRNPTQFGDLITVDHVHTRDKMGRGGVGGLVDSFTVLDVGAGCRYSIPVDAVDALETTRALQYVVGDQPVRRVYSDNIGQSARQPNARVERCNRGILDGTRVALVQAGIILPLCVKPNASLAPLL